MHVNSLYCVLKKTSDLAECVSTGGAVSGDVVLTNPHSSYATGFIPVEIGFCTTPIPFSGATSVVQKPVNHRDKPGGESMFACLRTDFAEIYFGEWLMEALTRHTARWPVSNRPLDHGSE
jgi:hypothetical protein